MEEEGGKRWVLELPGAGQTGTMISDSIRPSLCSVWTRVMPVPASRGRDVPDLTQAVGYEHPSGRFSLAVTC